MKFKISKKIEQLKVHKGVWCTLASMVLVVLVMVLVVLGVVLLEVEVVASHYCY